ncbi:MAG: AraC family transcriptional regulator [Verrucomicrobiota bacterium]
MGYPPKEADNCAPLSEAVEKGEVHLVAKSRGQYPGKRIPKGALPGLRTIGFWDAVGPQSWGLPMHRNEGIEICYVFSGECRFITNNGDWNLRAGDMTVTRPWQRHQLGDPTIRPCKLVWVILDVESAGQNGVWEFPSWIGPDLKARRALLRAFRKNQHCQFHDTDGHLKPLMERTCQQLKDESALCVAKLASNINALLVEVADYLAEGLTDPKKDPQGFDQTIRQFFHGLEYSVEKASESWSVGEMAHACRVGKSYLTSACRTIFNATPAEQLNRIRLNHARDILLCSPEMPITDVAFATGFNTSQYFANCFKRQFNCTPREYRKR